MIGTIVHLNESRGFGFIATAKAQYFFHVSQFHGQPLKGLEVSFEPAPGRISGKGPQAFDVRPTTPITANELIEKLWKILSEGGAK